MKEDDIRAYINNKEEESTFLEFKVTLDGTPEGKKEIAKDVSAFANAGGGRIIYGLQELDHKASDLNPIDGRVFTKEWLENVIDSNVHKPIRNIIITPVRIGDKIEETIYVVDIPESQEAAHQAPDKRFYRRLNFKNVMMEEYEIRQSYNRHQKTELKLLDLRIEPAGASNGQNGMAYVQFRLNYQVQNIGKAIETKSKLEVWVPQLLLAFGPFEVDPLQKYRNRTNGDYAVYSIPNSEPIFQGETLSFGTGVIRADRSAGILRHTPLKLILYYSDGKQEKNIDLSKVLFYGGAPILQALGLEKVPV